MISLRRGAPRIVLGEPEDRNLLDAKRLARLDKRQSWRNSVINCAVSR
jgi:hypothetical protein